MELTTAPATPASLEEVRALFENWRQNRKKRAPIPESLWEAAAANPIDYFTALQQNAAEITQAPENWLPWNYTTTL